MLNLLPWHTLPTFVVAAQCENLRATALQVHLTHGAVSQQIQLLEQRLGYTLFDRRGRGIYLNSAGRQLLAVVQPALLSIEQAVHQGRRQQQPHLLRISVLPSFAHYWLLPRLALFQRDCPGISLEIDASLQIQLLGEQGFDAAIRIGDGQWPGVDAQLIATGEVVPVAAPALAREWQSAFLAQQINVPLLAHDVVPWQAWCQAQQWPEFGQQVAIFNDAGLLIKAAEQGLGIALVRRVLVAEALTQGRLQALTNPCTLVGNGDFYLVSPVQSQSAIPLASPVQQLLHWLRQQMSVGA